jgi:hypothetical protein
VGHNKKTKQLRPRWNELPRTHLHGEDGFLVKLTWTLSAEERAELEQGLTASALASFSHDNGDFEGGSDRNTIRWVEVVRVTLNVLGIGTDVTIARSTATAFTTDNDTGGGE